MLIEWLICSAIMLTLCITFAKIMLMIGEFDLDDSEDRGGMGILTLLLTIFGPITLGLTLVVLLCYSLYRGWVVIMGGSFLPEGLKDVYQTYVDRVNERKQ